MMKIFIHNSWHFGDVLLTRVVIDSFRRKYPHAELLLQCRSPMQYLWKDYGIKIFDAQQDYISTAPTAECPQDFEFFNTWFGTFYDIINQFGLTPINQVHTVNRQMHFHNTNNFLDIPSTFANDKSFPALRLNDSGISVPDNAILVENGPPWSGQCNRGIGSYVSRLSSDFPHLKFLCSSDPQLQLPNVFSCAHYNLLQLSDISNKCIAFITQASGVNACTYTINNISKLRIFFGFAYPYKIWDDSAIHANDYDQLTSILRNKL